MLHDTVEHGSEGRPYCSFTNCATLRHSHRSPIAVRLF